MYEIEVLERRKSERYPWKTVTYDLSVSRDMAKFLARHPYSWPGGYPCYGVLEDGETLCCDCCYTQFRQIAQASPGDGWMLVGIDINYEDTHLHCAHCGTRINWAYEQGA